MGHADSHADDARAAVDPAGQSLPLVVAPDRYERAEFLYRAHAVMRERHEALAELMTLEQGKPLRAARNEVGYGADFLLWYAEEAKRVYGGTIPSSRADQRLTCCASRSGWSPPSPRGTTRSP